MRQAEDTYFGLFLFLESSIINEKEERFQNSGE